jgi:hypothetical protein
MMKAKGVKMMLTAIIVLVVTVLVLGYAFYLRNDDVRRYKGAIESHRAVKQAPYGLPDVAIDYVDEQLWAALDD